MEVWHAQPNGRYSTLGEESDKCRAKIETDSHGSFVFKSLAPGTYGSLNGLSPGGFDFPPFGPKLIHFRVTADGYKPLVTQVILHESENEIKLMDFRGPAMILGSSDGLPELELVGNTSEGGNKYKIKLVMEAAAAEEKQEEMCPSGIFWGLPTSFFTEPISVCKPALLRYFSL